MLKSQFQSVVSLLALLIQNSNNLHELHGQQIIKLAKGRMDREDQYGRLMQQSRENATRMRRGTGAANLLQADDAPTHQIDALERFQKDFAAYQKQRRETQNRRRNSELQRKRIELLQREDKRWHLQEINSQKLNEKQQRSVNNQLLGRKRTANMNGLPFNPITLQYDKNTEGEKLKMLDDDHKIKGYVRAHNMDRYGNSKYNPLNGLDRIGIEKVVPTELCGRFEKKKQEYYDGLRLKVPASLNFIPSAYMRYY